MNSDFKSIDVSVVIPTRNRFEHLQSTVKSIELQTHLPKEIIIVDSSDDLDFAKNNLKCSLSIKWISSKPSVCAQRNLGILSAASAWILLCDDDLELEKDYLFKLIDYTQLNKTVGAAAGLFLQKQNDAWVKNFPIKSFAGLLWNFIFQHSIWGDIDSVKSPMVLKPLHRVIHSFYKKRGNTQTLAGWPLITNWSGNVMQTKFYSVGANTLVKKDWLLQSPFDEHLDAHGIGDNYGVALGFPMPIHVLTNVVAYHHRAEENRYEGGKTKYLRILALDYFLRKRKASTTTRLFFAWSLFGHCLFSLIRERGNLKDNFRAFIDTVLRRTSIIK